MKKIKRGENFKSAEERESCYSDFTGKEGVIDGAKGKKF